MRRRAYEKRKRREDVHVIGVRNEIRGVLGADPIDPWEPGRPSPPTDAEEDALDALKYRVQQETDIVIEEDLTV
jgi:hypothetical protein